jgi:hypothetical protein
MTITLKQAQGRCRSLGVVLTRVDDEYRVNVKHGCEDTAYYTNDIDDAISTAEVMVDPRSGK